MAKNTKLDIFELSGGQNSFTSPLFIADNECELIQNYHLDNLGSLTKRNGIVNLVGQIVNDKPILGMYFYKDTQSTKTNVLAAIDDSSSTNSDIFDLESDAWVISNADDTAGALPVFCTFLSYVFRTNGSDVIVSSNDPPTSWGTTNLTNFTTYKPKYCCVWEDRVYAAYENGGTKYPSRLYWSDLPNSGTIDWTPATNWADINPDDNDEITWIEPFGQMMLVFKNKGLYRWTFGQVEPDKIIDVGTPQGRTVKQTQGICFFANENGVYAYTGGSMPRLISKKIQDYIDVIPTLANMRAEVDRDHYYLYVGDLSNISGRQDDDLSNVMLVYTISSNTWHIETYPFEVKSMARFESDTLGTTTINDAVYLGDDDGYIYQKDTGTSDYLGTTAKTINGRIVTKEYPLYNFPKSSVLRNAYFLARKAIGTKINYRIDRGDWRPLTDLKGRMTSTAISGRARTIQFSITDDSSKTSQIEGLSVELKGEDTIRR